MRDDRDRAGGLGLGLAGPGWAGLGALETRDCEARAPSKLSIGLALFDPDHRAVSCTPSWTRPRTGSRGTRCCSPCCFYKPVNPLRSASDRPVCLPVCLSVCAAPPPSAYVLCRTLRCEGLMLAHHAARTVALSSRPPACGDEIAVSCRFPPVFSLYLPMADSPARPAISSCT